MQQVAHHLELLAELALAHLQRDHDVVHVALGVGLQPGAQIVADADVVHHQPARLVLEDPVDPRDGLEQAVIAHRLVDVERVEHRRVEAGQPHVFDDDDAQRVVGVLEVLL